MAASAEERKRAKYEHLTSAHPGGHRVIRSCRSTVYVFSERPGSQFSPCYWRGQVHDIPPPEALCGSTKRE